MRKAFITIIKRIRISKLLYVAILTISASCGLLTRFSSTEEEESFFISRKYIGVFLDYRQTGPDDLAGPNLLWIKTNMEGDYGKISAYGKKCEFKPGEKLFLRRTLYDPGIVGSYWVYSIENDSTVSYRVTEFQHDHKIAVETIFQ